MSRTPEEECPPLLAPGFHDMDIGALRKLCVDDARFSASPTRPRIMGNLERTFGKLVNNSIVGELWVDGSFLTEAVDPKDVDLSLRVQGDFYDNATPAQSQAMDELTDIWDTELIDGYLHFEWPVGHKHYSIGQANYREWERQWGRSRSGVPKGIAVVKLPRKAP